MNNTLTALNGVRVGHSTHPDILTGTTVVLFDKPYSVAYKGYGGGVGSYNTDILRSGMSDYKQNAIFISGGSQTGLMAAAPIMECLRTDKVGFSVAGGKVNNPLLTGAVVFDLGMIEAPFNPDFGREAYQSATSASVNGGNVGAGTGTTVGKFQWLEKGTKSGEMKSGVGSARVDLGNGIIVCALTVVNALGNIVLPNGDILAGNRDETDKFNKYEDMIDVITKDRSNTTVSVVGINVDLRAKEYLERVAHLASHGQIRAINPVNTSMDGDTVFVFSTGEIKRPLNTMAKYYSDTEDEIYLLADVIGHAAGRAVQESIYDACRQSESIRHGNAYKGVIPSCTDY